MSDTNRTIKALSELKARVYILLTDEKVAEDFLRDATAEGFTFGDGVPPTERKASDIYALNPNMTLNFVGFIGHLAFWSGTGKTGDRELIRVDYKKYINGDDCYLIRPQQPPACYAYRNLHTNSDLTGGDSK